MGASASTTAKYSAKTTSHDIMKEFGSRARDKFVIVTGGNNGLGFETSRALAEFGAHVVIACRNPKLGQAAVQKIKAKHPQVDVSMMVLDLASLSSISQFAEEYRASQRPLHILVNNAGVMACPKSLTKDGHEMQFGVNHLGHFSLTMKLLDVMQSSSTPNEPARVVNVSSNGNFLWAPEEGICFNDLKGDRYYNWWERYASSKIANIVFAKEFTRRYNRGNTPIISTSLHPGVISGTNLQQHLNSLNQVLSLLRVTWRKGTFSTMLAEPNKTIEQGTATQLFCCLDPHIVGGEYYSDCKIDQSKVCPKANEEEFGKKLWEISEQLTK
eukprot:gene2389-2536_t